MKSSIALALSLFAAAACGHGAQRSTVSAVGNEDVTGNKSDPDNKKMTYVKVSNREALNHDATHREIEAQNEKRSRDNASDVSAQARATGAASQQCDLNVYFATASAELNERAKQQLNSIASCLKRRNVDETLIVGSADPRGSEQDNEQLGKERAQTVARYLEELGVPKEEIRIRSAGESQARAEPSTWPASRRAEVQDK